MLDLVAKKLFLTKGVGVADDKLTSFEFALETPVLLAPILC